MQPLNEWSVHDCRLRYVTLNYLVLIEAESILPRIFGQVFIPPAVLAELSHPNTPTLVRIWTENIPEWLQMNTPYHLGSDIDLDREEAEAISLSLQLGADALLMDDRKGRIVASKRGLITIGVIGALEIAARRGLIDLQEVFDRLNVTNFRAAPRLLQKALARVEAARRTPPTV